LSAATCGLEWTKSSLTSVRTSLQAETNAVMKSLNSSSDRNAKGDVGHLRRRGVLLRDQHKLLLSLFRRFQLQGKRIQQIYHGDDDEDSQSQSADDGWLSEHCENTGALVTTSAQPTNSKTALGKKRWSVCDNAAVSKSEYNSEAVCTANQLISMSTLSHAALVQSVSDANVTNTTSCDVTGYRGRVSGTTEAVSERLDASYSSGCGCGVYDGDGRCWADRSSDHHSQLSVSCQQSDVFHSHPAGRVVTAVSVCHTCNVTYSHVDTASDCSRDGTASLSRIGQVPVTTTVMSTAVTVPCTTAAAAAAGRSTSSLPSFSSLTVCDSLSASQPICELIVEPPTKKLRLPPPSPSLLSLSSSSPPMSPLLLPVTHPRHLAPPRYPVRTYLPISQQSSHYVQQTTGTGMLQCHSVPLSNSMTGPSSIVSNITRSTGLPAPVSAVAAAAVELSASQSSQKSLMKTTQRSFFSLRQLIADGIIQPGHNVLTTQNPVMFYCEFCFNDV